jgi:Mor family transcriptional regulator
MKKGKRPKEKTKRNANIYGLHIIGVSLRDLSKKFKVSHTRIRTIIQQEKRNEFTSKNPPRS